jgi:hypothetical protein
MAAHDVISFFFLPAGHFFFSSHPAARSPAVRSGSKSFVCAGVAASHTRTRSQQVATFGQFFFF